MASTPIIKQASLLSLIPQLLVLGLCIYLFYGSNLGDPFLLGALAFIIITFSVRRLIPKSHRRGIALVKHQKFAEAIPLFEASVAYFTKHKWVDKYRYITILSSSKMSYREMGLCNIAFCYSQIGNGQKAKEYYEQTLREYPDNGLAIAGLNMLNATQHGEHK